MAPDHRDLEPHEMVGPSLFVTGYWANRDGSGRLPDPRDHVDENWIGSDRWRKVVAYLRSFPRVNHYRGWSNCRICGCQNGSAEHSDGVYLWPEGLAHYVEEHGVVPPQGLVGRALHAMGAKVQDAKGVRSTAAAGERIAVLAQIHTEFAVARAAGKVEVSDPVVHSKGCTCGVCDGSGEGPGAEVVLYGWDASPADTW